MTISEFYRATLPVTGVNSEVARPEGKKLESPIPGEFQKELDRLITQNVSMSKHAENRIISRSLDWNPNLQDRIVNGLDRAEAKGSRETLILADNVAVIADVKSRTIVTAMDRTQLKDRVFTNIDSTVLV